MSQLLSMMKIKEAHTAFVLVSNLSRTLQQTAKQKRGVLRQVI